ncbi:MAG TPA: hypothetical protein VMU95_07270 [Trebonia sp.]|nr:hypothetical protein [Trebonia sp.]
MLGRNRRDRRRKQEATEPDRVARAQSLTSWKTAYEMVAEMAFEAQVDRVIEMHGRLVMPPSPLSARLASIIAWIEWRILFLYRPLTDDVLEVAAQRLTAIIDSGVLRLAAADSPTSPEAVPWDCSALALLRLRQKRYEDVERLCAQVQASAGVTPNQRAWAFATVAWAWREQGKPDDGMIEAAAGRGLDITDAVADIRRALQRDQVCLDLASYTPNSGRPADPARTDRLLEAYRAGDRATLHQVWLLASMLLEEGRTEELRELYASFPFPRGPEATQHAKALGNLSYIVLLDAGVPADVIAEAETRVNWILETGALWACNPIGRAAQRHNLALAQLRRGRWADVEELCAESLALTQMPPESRANVLATVVLARRALGEPSDSLLAEAVRLAPDATLVKEACQGMEPT